MLDEGTRNGAWGRTISCGLCGYRCCSSGCTWLIWYWIGRRGGGIIWPGRGVGEAVAARAVVGKMVADILGSEKGDSTTGERLAWTGSGGCGMKLVTRASELLEM